MGAVHRYPDTRHARLKIRQPHDLARLVHHLHFLVGVTVVEEYIDVRQHVERDLVWVNLPAHFPALVDLADLALEFRNAHGARAGHRLIRGGENSLHSKRLVQWIQRHHRDDCRAVRISNDALVPGNIGGVDLRHHQRHRVIHPKRAGIIDDHRAGLNRSRGEFLGNSATRAEQSDVHPIE